MMKSPVRKFSEFDMMNSPGARPQVFSISLVATNDNAHFRCHESSPAQSQCSDLKDAVARDAVHEHPCVSEMVFKCGVSMDACNAGTKGVS